MNQVLPKWEIQGELILNCNCTVFCPCVVSLGVHYPTEGHCQAWLGVHVVKGFDDDVALDALNVGMVLDIPGRMSRGDWKVGTFIDDRADERAFQGLSRIFKGEAGGTTRLFSMLVSEHLGMEKAAVTFERREDERLLTVDKKIVGGVKPIAGSDVSKDVSVNNTSYWMGPDIIVAQATKGRVRAFGRVWDFEGRSAEICQINWSGPH